MKKERRTKYYCILPILNIEVLHLLQLPLTQSRPLAILSALAPLISLFSWHFMQYPSTIGVTSLPSPRVWVYKGFC